MRVFGFRFDESEFRVYDSGFLLRLGAYCKVSQQLDFVVSREYKAQVFKRKGRQNNYNKSAQRHKNSIASSMVKIWLGSYYGTTYP